MKIPHTPADEIVDRGIQIYDEKLRELLEPAHLGQYVVIDVDSGDFEVDAEHIAAFDRIKAKHPTARLYATRVGFKVLAHIGGRLTVARQT